MSDLRCLQSSTTEDCNTLTNVHVRTLYLFDCTDSGLRSAARSAAVHKFQEPKMADE